MANSTTEVVALLREAETGSYELTRDVLIALGWQEDIYKRWFIPPSGERLSWIDHPKCTQSLDAALSLIPEGWFTSNAHQNFETGEWYWSIGCNADHPDALKERDGIRSAWDTHGAGPTAALALCVALLLRHRACSLDPVL